MLFRSTAAVVVDGSVIGHVGEIDRSVLEVHGLAGPVVAAEIDLGALLGASRRERRYVAPSRFPASGVDLAFVLDDAVPAAAVIGTLRAAAGDLLEDVRTFDVFRSEALGEGRRSVAFALRFRSPERTLTDTEVGEARAACIAAVTEAHAAELR